MTLHPMISSIIIKYRGRYKLDEIIFPTEILKGTDLIFGEYDARECIYMKLEAIPIE